MGYDIGNTVLRPLLGVILAIRHMGVSFNDAVQRCVLGNNVVCSHYCMDGYRCLVKYFGIAGPPAPRCHLGNRVNLLAYKWGLRSRLIVITLTTIQG